MIRFRQIEGADSGRELEFDQDLIRIGRMPDSDVNFDPEVDLDASGRHAEIRNENGRYLLIDMGSRNGTWLNGQRIKHAALDAGDEIELGRGGPKLEIAFLANRPPKHEPSGRRPATSGPRDPRFDPLAVPVTTATRLEDLVARPDLLPDGVRIPERARGGRGNSGRQRISIAWWAAAGLALVAAIAILVAVSLR